MIQLHNYDNVMNKFSSVKVLALSIIIISTFFKPGGHVLK